MPQDLDLNKDESLEQVQSKIAYLEHAVAELSDVVFRQHKEIGALEMQLKALRERLDSVRFDETTRTAEQERPAHNEDRVGTAQVGGKAMAMVTLLPTG